MKIAIWHNLPSGGGKRALFDHVKGLVRKGHHVEAWSPQTADSSYLPLRDLIEEHVVPLEMEAFKERSKPALTATRAIQAQLKAMDEHCRKCAEEMRQGQFDILFANACSLFRMPFIARHISIPKALYLQEPYRDLYEAGPTLVWSALPNSGGKRHPLSRIKRLAEDVIRTQARRIQVREERANAAFFDTILVNSLFSRESVARAYGLESAVCYLGIDTELFHPTGEPREQYVIGLGGLHYNKGVDRAIRGLAEIPREERPKLIWIGNFSDIGAERSIRSLAETLRVDWELKVRIDDTELVSLLSRAALMIYTSRLEPFGFAPLEASACGTPVVAIAEGGVRETVFHGKNGLLVLSANPRELAFAMQRVLDEPALARQMAEEGPRYVQSEWNLDDAIKRLETKLFELLGEGPRPRHVDEDKLVSSASVTT